MNTKINKNDILLIIPLLIISAILIFIMNIKKEANNIAKVYYDGKLIKKIDLSINKIYNIKGYNGNVKIKVKNHKIRVIEEKSMKHICSKNGYINKSYQSIICLPNKIVIEIDGSKIDTVVK